MLVENKLVVDGWKSSCLSQKSPFTRNEGKSTAVKHFCYGFRLF